MTLNEHLGCPKCGYDLHGIPERRCPECGFGYDAAALRELAASSDWQRWAAARQLIVRATIAAALLIPFVCDRLAPAPWLALTITFVAVTAAFVTWGALGESYPGHASIPILLPVFFAVQVSAFFWITRILALFAGLFVLASAWFLRVMQWNALSPAENSRTPTVHRLALRYSDIGTALLLTASLLAVLAFLG